jgi:hypothetical protein
LIASQFERKNTHNYHTTNGERVAFFGVAIKKAIAFFDKKTIIHKFAAASSK